MGVESKIREMLAKGKEVESALNEETQELDEAGAAEHQKSVTHQDLLIQALVRHQTMTVVQIPHP